MANFEQYIKTSFQDYGLPSERHEGHTLYSGDCAKADIQYLYQKIKDFSRETTQWDLYKITQVVNNQDEFQAQVNSLPPYSSAIIASKFVSEDGDNYSQGDLVYKNLDGSVTHIQSERGGVFRPTSITKDANNYTISFQYISKEPTENATESVVESGGQWISTDTQKKQVEFKNLSVATPSSIYGIVKSKNEFSNNSFDFTKKSAFPIIKMYNSSNEEIYADFNIVENTTSWIISNIPSIVETVVVK